MFSSSHLTDFHSSNYFKILLNGKLAFTVYALLGCLLLYAFKGSPTPDNPSIIELAIALLLVMSVGVAGIVGIFSIINMREYKTHILFFIFGLTIPVFIGLFQGFSLFIMMRDVVAFLLLCLPILFLYNIKNTNEFSFSLFLGCAVIAIVFCARVIFNDIPFLENTNELLYLANSPLVLFFAIYFVSASYNKLLEYKKLKNFILFILLFSMSIFILFAMAQDVQRATLLAVFLSFIFIVVNFFIKNPARSVVPIIFMSVLVFYAWPTIETILIAIEAKTSLVGFNARYQELTAVWQEIGRSPLKILFGLGWGTQFESPALGGLHASFTHSLLSYMLLKTGLIGLFITLLYCGMFLHKIFNIFLKNRIVGIALFWSFVIPVFLYASYKSFDFGLLLTLIMAFSLFYKNNDKTFNSNY